MTLNISRELLLQICEHGQRHYPEEGAGLILGKMNGEDRWASRILPLENKFQPESRRNRYMINPEDLLVGEQEAERVGLDVIGVFHSHPDHPAEPSEYDRQWALPWYSYLITRVDLGHTLESRSWRLNDDRSHMMEETLNVHVESYATEKRLGA